MKICGSKSCAKPVVGRGNRATYCHECAENRNARKQTAYRRRGQGAEIRARLDTHVWEYIGQTLHYSVERVNTTALRRLTVVLEHYADEHLAEFFTVLGQSPRHRYWLDALSYGDVATLPLLEEALADEQEAEPDLLDDVRWCMANHATGTRRLGWIPQPRPVLRPRPRDSRNDDDTP